MSILPPKTPQDYLDRAEACERLADIALSEETRQIMQHLAFRWRELAAETEAETERRPSPGHPLTPSG